MTVLYIDTNIFLDAVKNRTNLFGKNIGNSAAKIFYDSFTCKYHLVISTWTLEELRMYVKPEEVKMLFDFIKKKILTVKYTDEDKEKAKQKSKIHYDDALHIILAEKKKVDYIITRNIEHFLEIGTKIPIKKPEKLF